MFICLLRLWTHVRGACLSRLLVVRCMDTYLHTVPLFPCATVRQSTHAATCAWTRAGKQADQLDAHGEANL